MMAEICIYDRVTLLNGLQGEVQFMGHMENNKRDCFYGIKLNSNQGQNNGTYNGIKYFSCSYNHGIFVTKDQIVDSKPTTFNERLPRVCIGDAVNVTYKKQNGILRFVGSVSNHDGCSYGVEFLGPFGDTNGCKDGRKYFDCLNYHGLFCCFDNIQLVPKTEPQNTANTMNIHNGLDPALHDLDPTKDDIYKPIATTFDPSTYDTAQSVIYNAECDQETNTNTSIQPNYITNPWQNQTNSAVSYNTYAPNSNWSLPQQSSYYPNNNHYAFNHNTYNTSTFSKSEIRLPHSKPHTSNQNTSNVSKSATTFGSNAHKWQTAYDGSGRQYWYHPETNTTTWNAPPCVSKCNNNNNNIQQKNPYCDPNLNATINTYSPQKNKEYIRQHSAQSLEDMPQDARCSVDNKCWQLGAQQTYDIDIWAKYHFALESHKKGLFGKKQQRLADVLSFTEFNKMKVPLHKTTNKEIETQCMQTWKNINSYIGIRKSSKSSMGHVHKLLLYALKGEDVVRNEIYCQLIKQTTRNPKLTSAIKGWKLLLICCSFFPPSQEFIAYLSCYLWSHTQQTNGIGPFAVKALHALDRIVLEGPRTHLPLPSEIEKN
eukprot:56853_1